MSGRDRRFDLSFAQRLRDRRNAAARTGDSMNADQLREVAAQMRDDATMMIDRIRVQYWTPLVQDAIATLLENAADDPHPDLVAVAAAYRAERPPQCSAIVVQIDGETCGEHPCRLPAGHAERGQRHAP